MFESFCNKTSNKSKQAKVKKQMYLTGISNKSFPSTTCHQLSRLLPFSIQQHKVERSSLCTSTSGGRHIRQKQCNVGNTKKQKYLQTYHPFKATCTNTHIHSHISITNTTSMDQLGYKLPVVNCRMLAGVKVERKTNANNS